MTLLDQSQALLQEGRSMLTSTSAPSIEVKKDEVIEMNSAIQSVIDELEDKIAAKRKEKRVLDDIIQDLQSELRRYDHANKDLSHMTRRLNSRFWDVKKERTNSNISDKEPSNPL